MGGIGAAMSEIKSAYEELSLVFDPPKIVDGRPTVAGRIVGPDGSFVIVEMIGLEKNLKEASVILLIPNMLFEFPTVGAEQPGKILFVRQVLLDVVFPNWEESDSWLKESLISVGEISNSEAFVETEQGNSVVHLGSRLLEGEWESFLSIGLRIKSK